MDVPPGTLFQEIQERISQCARLPNVRKSELGTFDCVGKIYSIPKISLQGRNASDPIRIGIFAGIHGDEPAGSLAVIELLTRLARQTELAENYQLSGYPVCNPTGLEQGTRESLQGCDLNREFWKNSNQPEIQLLEKELLSRQFQGLIQLHADDTSEGLYGFVRGATLTENLLRPALLEAGKILPRNINAQIDGFAARDGIIHDHYDGILASPARMDPAPFEIILETPGRAGLDRQVEALVAGMITILDEYRKLISFAANL